MFIRLVGRRSISFRIGGSIHLTIRLRCVLSCVRRRCKTISAGNLQAQRRLLDGICGKVGCHLSWRVWSFCMIREFYTTTSNRTISSSLHPSILIYRTLRFLHLFTKSAFHLFLTSIFSEPQYTRRRSYYPRRTFLHPLHPTCIRSA